MKIIDEALLDCFRRKEACEWCHARTRAGLDPHHIIAKGMGGGNRLDHPWNLVALCRACHQLVHQGQILRIDLWAIVAAREGVLQEAIERELWSILRLPRSDYSSPTPAEKSPARKRKRSASRTRKRSGK